MFNIRLKELREHQGMTQQEFANAFGISKGTIGMWESGAREPRNLNELQRIADYFSVSVDYLVGHDEQEKKPTPISKGEPDRNIIKIAGRDGTYVERELTDEQAGIMKSLLEQLKPVDDGTL